MTKRTRKFTKLNFFTAIPPVLLSLYCCMADTRGLEAGVYCS